MLLVVVVYLLTSSLSVNLLLPFLQNKNSSGGLRDCKDETEKIEVKWLPGLHLALNYPVFVGLNRSFNMGVGFLCCEIAS